MPRDATDIPASGRVRPRPDCSDPLMGGGPPVRVGRLVGQIKNGRVEVGLRGARGGNGVMQAAMHPPKKAESYQRLVQDGATLSVEVQVPDKTAKNNS